MAWDDLGIYQLLAELPLGPFGSCGLHRGLRALIEDSRLHFLARTLECYLDAAVSTDSRCISGSSSRDRKG